MSEPWKRTRLGDVCRVIPGYAFKSSDWQAEGIPVVKIKNITTDNAVDLTETDCVPESVLTPKLQKFVLNDGDILLAMTGATAGKVGKVRTKRPILLNQRVAKIAPVEADHGFIWSVVSSQEYQEKFFYLADGAAQPNMSGGQIERLEIPCPPLPVQRRIAGILSAYDELMENSQRRIRLLEAMARALYREWFVHFRFPGHEKHPRVASPLGDIPKGWEVTTLRAVTTKIGSGATPRGGKDAYKTEGIHLIRSLNIYDYSFEFADLAFIDAQQAAELDNVTVEENDILLNITGASVARCALVLSYLLPARVNQHVAIVRADPAKASPFYVLDAINSDNRKAQLLALAQGGATREALTKDTVSNFEIVLPPRPLMKRYDAIARGIHKQREVLLRQIQNLRRTRDLLLPRLLSGQVELNPKSA